MIYFYYVQYITSYINIQCVALMIKDSKHHSFKSLQILYYFAYALLNYELYTISIQKLKTLQTLLKHPV